jgi:MFS family permease
LNSSHVQRRTLGVLFVSQMSGGVGMSIGMSVGALLTADLVSVGVSGLAQSAAVLGAAILAVPATRLARAKGRAPSLASAYLVAALGGALTVAAAMTRSIPLLFMGLFLFGGGTTAGLQSRYAAVDLAPPAQYGRHLSLIVWATTLGGVLGPNLASFAGVTLSDYAVPTLAAPFAFSVVLFTFAAAFLFIFLRPDPLKVAQVEGAKATQPTAAQVGMGAAFRAVMANVNARLGVAATAIGHVVMVGVMSMTPVHIRSAGHPPAHTLRIVGVVLSVHIAGMYALAPVMGLLSDRFGRRAVIFGGVAMLITACAVAGTAGHDATRLAIGLILLGLGWSATMVSGSAMLSQSIEPALKPSAQGLSDLLMGIAGASAGALSGVVVANFGYPALTLAAAITTLPLAALAVLARPIPSQATASLR